MAERQDKRVRLKVDIEDRVEKFIQDEQRVRRSPDRMSFNDAINTIIYRYFDIEEKLRNMKIEVPI